MRFRSTAVLAIVLALLCAAYWFLGRAEEQAAHQAVEARRLVEFAAGSIARIEVRRSNAEPVLAERVETGRWTLLKPSPDIAADSARWESMAAVVAEMLSERTIREATGDLSAYGLDAPVLVVAADAVDGRGVRVSFGSMEPIQVNRYARVNDGPVILISNKTFQKLNRSLGELRDRRVFHRAPEEVLRIEFARIWNGRGDAPSGPVPELGAELGRVAVERAAPSEPWRVVEPVEAPADAERIAAFLQEFPNAMGQAFIDQPENLSDYGLDPAWARLTLSAGEGVPPETLYLGSADLKGQHGNGVFTKHPDQPAVMVIEPQLVNVLPLTRTHFRDARLLTRSIKGLNQVHYLTPATEFVLQKYPAQGWQMVMPPVEQTDQVAVSTLIGTVVQLTALDFPSDSPDAFGLQQPQLILTLSFEQGAPIEIRFAAGPEGSDACFATQDTGAVMMLPAEALESLVRTPSDFQTFELLRFNRTDAVELEITADDRRYELENRGGVWQVTSPENCRLQNQDDVRKILAVLSPFTAEEALPLEAGAPLAPFGLDRPALTATVKTRAKEPDAEPVTHGPVFIGGVVEGQPQRRYAAVRGRNGVYLIHQEAADQLREGLLGLQVSGGQ